MKASLQYKLEVVDTPIKASLQYKLVGGRHPHQGIIVI